MNLYFRLIKVLIVALFRDRLLSDNLANEVHTMVYPNDLDINLHMNNGRFLTLCDLGRIDMFVRAGLLRVIYKKKWMPIVSHVSMTFIKSLYVFDRIRVASEITHWDEKYFYSTHTIYRRDQKVAEGTSKSLVVSKKHGRITPLAVITAVNESWS